MLFSLFVFVAAAASVPVAADDAPTCSVVDKFYGVPRLTVSDWRRFYRALRHQEGRTATHTYSLVSRVTGDDVVRTVTVLDDGTVRMISRSEFFEIDASVGPPEPPVGKVFVDVDTVLLSSRGKVLSAIRHRSPLGAEVFEVMPLDLTPDGCAFTSYFIQGMMEDALGLQP